MISKSVFQIFKNLFQTGNINIFVLRDVFFDRYDQLKRFFSDEKNIFPHFSREAIKVEQGKVSMENFIFG